MTIERYINLTPAVLRQRDFEPTLEACQKFELERLAQKVDRNAISGIRGTLSKNGIEGLKEAIPYIRDDWENQQAQHIFFNYKPRIRNKNAHPLREGSVLSAESVGAIWNSDEAIILKDHIHSAHEHAVLTGEMLPEINLNNELMINPHCCAHINLPKSKLTVRYFPDYLFELDGEKAIVDFRTNFYEQDKIARVQTFLRSSVVAITKGGHPRKLNLENLIYPNIKHYIRTFDRSANTPRFMYIDISTQPEEIPMIRQYLEEFSIDQNRKARKKGMTVAKPSIHKEGKPIQKRLFY